MHDDDNYDDDHAHGQLTVAASDCQSGRGQSGGDVFIVDIAGRSAKRVSSRCLRVNLCLYHVQHKHIQSIK